MDKYAYLDGYMYKEADDKNVPRGTRYRNMPAYNKGMHTDPGGRIMATYAANKRAPKYFSRVYSIDNPYLQWPEGPAWDEWSKRSDALYDNFFAAADQAYALEMAGGGRLPAKELVQAREAYKAAKAALDEHQLKRDELFPTPDDTDPSYHKWALPVTQQHIQAIKALRPGLSVEHSSDEDYYYATPEDNLPGKPEGRDILSIPQVGAKELPELYHEFAHSVDSMAGVNREGTNEPEIPAMVAERAAERLAGRPIPRPATNAAMYLDEQVDKFGPPVQRGAGAMANLKHVQDYMQSIRQKPGATLSPREPYAYSPGRDERSGEDRAKAMGTAYKRWMDRQVSDNKKPME